MRHIKTSGALSVTLIALLAACSSGTASSKGASEPVPATGSRHGPDADNASDAPWSDAAPHRFAPGAQEPHSLPPRSASLDLNALPLFEDGSARCLARAHYYPSPRPSPPRHYMSPGVTAPRDYRKSAMKLRSRGSVPSSDMDESEFEESLAAEAEGDGVQDIARSPGPAIELQSLKRRKARPGAKPQPREFPNVTRPRRAGLDWGASIYLSNDDTMSLSSAQRLIYAIDNYAPLTPQSIRPHELLNYFSFQTRPVAKNRDFSVLPSISRSPNNPSLWSLGFAVRGRPATKSSRRNANLSFVLDRSGSMRAEGRMEYIKRGLALSLGELKRGDIVHVTLFDSRACNLARNFVVGRDSMSHLRSLIQRIQPTGSTDLQEGLVQGYLNADSAYQPSYTNRVVMITDAETNSGVTNEALIATVGKYYDQRKIRLSGVGVGRSFNDSLLDSLTERGKGAYVFLGSGAEVDAVFGQRFVSLIETVANDVHFRMHLPPSLALRTFYGEEASKEKSRVQAIHYFAGTSQMFLSDLTSRYEGLAEHDELMFTIEYEDPESGTKRSEDFLWTLGSIMGGSKNLSKAHMVNDFARELRSLASRIPQSRRWGRHSWVDDGAYFQCEETKERLAHLAEKTEGDPEAERVKQLWNSYCDRYRVASGARSPDSNDGRNNDFAPRDEWPSARK